MTVLDRCLKVQWKLRDRFLPGVRYPQEEYERLLHQRVTANVRWLDVGCGRRLLPRWRGEAEQALLKRSAYVVGLDGDCSSIAEHESIRALVLGNVDSLPFSENSFDVVSANMVLEHLRDPLQSLREIARVLKPGGVFVFHTPNKWGHHTLAARLIPERAKAPLIRLATKRAAKDVFPTYYRINSSRAVQSLSEKAGFAVEELRMIQGEPLAILVLAFPLLVAEMLWIRLLTTAPLRALRGNMIGVLRRV